VDVRVHGRNMDLTDDLRELAEERVGHAERIFEDVTTSDVEFSQNSNPRNTDGRFRVEITSRAAGHLVRVVSDAFDARAALDTAAEKYERQLRKLKERLIQRSRGNKDKALNDAFGTVDEGLDRTASVVRKKTFEMRPMSAEEAALQMELLGHDFFFFLDGDSGKHSVIYHRRDGDLGLIEPK
jgi:ribosome hibernation promoting factor